jgi:hypothetical protein
MTLLPPGSSELSPRSPAATAATAAARKRADGDRDAAQTPATQTQTPLDAAAQPIADAPPAEPTLVPEETPASAPDDGPLPDIAGHDELQLLVQSPYRLYAYWQHAHDPYETLRRAVGTAANGYRLVVRLLDRETNATLIDDAPPARNYWFDTLPGRAYRAELGFEAADKPFVRLLSSEVAQTPPVGVAAELDEVPEFEVRPQEFAHVVNEAGYAADALAVALQANDETAAAARARSQTPPVNTLALAHTLSAAPLPPLGAAELNDLRALIVALVFDEPLARIRARLAPPLARWLDALLAEHGAHVEQSRLLTLLRELFGFELEVDETGGDIEALRPTSPAWSASAVRQPERRVRIWLPSMSPGRAGPINLRPQQPSSLGGSDSWLPSMSARQHAPLLRWRKLVSSQ